MRHQRSTHTTTPLRVRQYENEVLKPGEELTVHMCIASIKKKKKFWCPKISIFKCISTLYTYYQQVMSRYCIWKFVVQNTLNENILNLFSKTAFSTQKSLIKRVLHQSRKPELCWPPQHTASSLLPKFLYQIPLFSVGWWPARGFTTWTPFQEVPLKTFDDLTRGLIPSERISDLIFRILPALSKRCQKLTSFIPSIIPPSCPP